MSQYYPISEVRCCLQSELSLLVHHAVVLWIVSSVLAQKDLMYREAL